MHAYFWCCLPGWYLTQRAEKLRLTEPEGAHGAPVFADNATLTPPLQLGGGRVGDQHCTCGTSGFSLRTVRCLQPLHDGTNRPVHSTARATAQSRRPCNRVPLPGPGWKTGLGTRWVRTLRGREGGAMCVEACETYFNFASVSGGLCVNGETVTLCGISKHLGLLRKNGILKQCLHVRFIDGGKPHSDALGYNVV